ncbi:MAG: STAS domain-containing protein [candidate division Zixibacteria bacterium]|nr:STAS domain-containing protein [candidate division Zixibacteria bacterium]
MSDIKISVETTQYPEIKAEITVIRVDGVIDTMTASELEKVTISLLEQKRYNIIIDLGGVDYISSAGWGIFISNIREIRLNNGDIKLARMIPNVYEIFELLEFDSILKAFDNIAKAKSDFLGGTPTGRQKNKSKSSEMTIVPEEKIDDNTENRPAKDPQMLMGEVATKEKIKIKARTKKKSNNVSENKNEQLNSTDAAHPVKTEKSHDKTKNLKQVIMDVVSKDPFLSVGEIKKTIAIDFPGLGFFQTWWTLRKLELGSKKKRFNFARTRRFAK